MELYFPEMISWSEPQRSKLFPSVLIPQDTNDEDVALFDAEEDAGKRSKAKIKYVNRWLLCDHNALTALNDEPNTFGRWIQWFSFT